MVVVGCRGYHLGRGPGGTDRAVVATVRLDVLGRRPACFVVVGRGVEGLDQVRPDLLVVARHRYPPSRVAGERRRTRSSEPAKMVSASWSRVATW